MKINHTDLAPLLKKELQTCNKEHDLLQIKSKFIGKKGYLTNLFSSLKDIDPDKRKEYGAELNQTKNILNEIIDEKVSELKTKNEIVSGLIFDPIKDEMFYAEKNNGAFFNNQRIRVSKKNNIQECLFAVGKIKNELDLICRRSGCAALDMAYVASGRYDGYFQKNLNLWDIAAGIILIKEAGGIVNEIDLSTFKNIKVLASSAEINTKFIEKIDNF